MGRNKTGYGTNPMSNDLIVVVDFDKTILAIIPVIVEGNIHPDHLERRRRSQRRVVRPIRTT